MNLFLIERYIQKIKKEDIYNYVLSQGITLKQKELDTIYYYLKNYYRFFLTNPSIRQQLLTEIKNKVEPNTASKIDELYNQYKNNI